MPRKNYLLLSTTWLVASVVVALGLFAEAYPQEILTSVDTRSLKGKIDPANTSPILVEIAESGYRFNRRELPGAALLGELDELMDTRMPGDRTIFVTAEGGTPFSRVVDLLIMGRKLEVDDFAMSATGSMGKFDSASATPIKIVLEEPDSTRPKPGPRFLGIELSSAGSLSLNGKRVSETALVTSLRQIFDSRRKRRIYVSGSRDVEKTVFVRVPLSTKFKELLRVLKIVQSSKASPIALEIDWLS